MHRLLLVTFGLLLFSLVALPALAAETLPNPGSPAAEALPGNWFDGLIPLLAPALIALVKVFVPRIPKALLPWLAPLLGAAVDWVGQLAGLSAGNPVMGALLGAAGVAVREAVDQAKKTITNSGLPASSLLLVGMLFLALAFTGCKTKRPEGQIVSFTQRVIGIDASENAVNQTPQLRLGFVSTTYHVVPTGSNIAAPPVSSSIDLSHKPFATGITEQFSTGSAAK